MRPQPDGTLIVNGDVTIRDLNREFEWALPDEEAATVAGLVMHEAAAGVEERVIMSQTRHKRAETMRKYVRLGSLFQQNAAARVGL